ncbi:MAG TPA: DUF2855 family protein [Solirubrobacteraceae bacterium]|nr:DUF2855 family protein [Solirubrobacteraceae bacterium]
MTDFLVRRDELRECRVAEAPPPEPGPGQARLRIDTFGLTANNVTYAVFGEAMSYWDFFPAEAGWGRVPVWGFAEVERSEAKGLEPGTRVYGYLPPSTHLIVQPARTDPQGFLDGSPHRAGLAAAYQRYLLTGRDPLYRGDTEELQMLLRPLFITSFLIDDQLADAGLVEQGPILISSASSKTAIGVAFRLAQHEGAEVVGLTSGRSADFVDGLGIYKRTVTYDEIDSLPSGPATFVDIAGDGGVRHTVHAHYGGDLLSSMAVGATHRGELTVGHSELPGPSPTLFFAPDRVVKRSADWGPEAFARRVADAWHPFCAWAGGWIEVLRSDGFDAVRQAYLDVLDGRVPPTAAHVLSVG